MVYFMIPIIKSKLFVLRPFKRGDEVSLRRSVNDWHIYRYTALIPYPYTMKHARDWIKKNISLNSNPKKGEINFAIVIDGNVVGGIGLRSMWMTEVETHKAEIGYWLAKRHWGKGIMTEAVRLVTDYAFKHLKLQRIYAAVMSNNKASARILEKVGFNFEGTLKRNYLKDGKFIDAIMYAKTR